MLSPLGRARRADQGRGIGPALSRAVLALADRRPEPLVVVQGHPDLLPAVRVRARPDRSAILPPEHLGPIDQAWMARRTARRPPEIRGRVVYPQAFRELD